jgi:hypothetical protein
MKKTSTNNKKNKKVVKEELDIIEDTKEYKRVSKENDELFLEKDHHGIKVFLSLLVIILLLGIVGFLYYKKVYSSPLITFTNSLSRYQKELTSDYQVDTYNKINAIISLDLKTSDESKKKGIDVLNNISSNIVFANEKDDNYLEVNTKYKKDIFLNLKLYSKEDHNKTYSYIKIDKFYDNYLKKENKYLQYYSLIKLLHEEDLSDLFKGVLKDSFSKDNFTRSEETINNTKLTKNTMTIKSSDIDKTISTIINKLKNDKNLLNKINKYYNNVIEKLESYLEKVKNDPKDLEISTYNKINIHQDLVILEYKYGSKIITLEPYDNVVTINIDNNGKSLNTVITKNNKASYNIDFNYKNDTDTYNVNLIVTLDKTNDVPTIIISDEMSVKELNEETLPELIKEVKDETLKDILRLLQKKSS